MIPPRPLAKLVFAFSLLFCGALSTAQSLETASSSLVNGELRFIADSVLHHPEASVRWKFHERLQDHLEELLWDDPNSVLSLADSLPTLSILSSKDLRALLVSWVVPTEGNVYKYGAILRFQKGKSPNVYRLSGQGGPKKALEARTLQLTEWYGALYYDLIQKGRGKNRHYIVLGWDQFTPTANRKIIDAIRWHEELERPVLDAPLEDARGNDVKRMIFGYREDASMSLRYHSKEKRLVWDHLTPISGAPAGMADFMVPDFSYDGLKYKRGKWRFLENIAPENERE